MTIEPSIARMTRQRRIILEELRRLKTHPTADDLYEIVRKRLPRISLGTVYRNLDVLSRTGTILRLEMGGSQYRFDGNAMPHCHVRCIECGRVADVESALAALPLPTPEAACGYRVTGYRMEYTGTCPECRNAEMS
jgi:Fur family ferric uptake transcriptional regulator